MLENWSLPIFYVLITISRARNKRFNVKLKNKQVQDILMKKWTKHSVCGMGLIHRREHVWNNQKKLIIWCRLNINACACMNSDTFVCVLYEFASENLKVIEWWDPRWRGEGAFALNVGSRSLPMALLLLVSVFLNRFFTGFFFDYQ